MSDLLKEQAYHKLMAMILSAKIEEGKMYSLNKVTENLGLSRTPVRDALQRLNDEKRIDILPSRGFCLHVMDDDELHQRYHFSNAIEGYAIMHLIELCKTDPKNRYIIELERLLAEMEHADLDEMSFKDFYELDNDFHNALIKSVGDEFFNNVSKENLGFIDHPEIHLSGRYLDRRQILNYHQRIIEAIQKKDVYAGYEAIMEHGKYVYEMYLANK